MSDPDFSSGRVKIPSHNFIFQRNFSCGFELGDDLTIYEGINLDLNAKRVSEAVDIVLKDNSPVILHAKLNDYETDSKKILDHLITLSNEN